MPNGFSTYLTQDELDEPDRRAFTQYVAGLPDLEGEQNQQRFRAAMADLPPPEPAPLSDLDRFRQRVGGWGAALGQAAGAFGKEVAAVPEGLRRGLAYSTSPQPQADVAGFAPRPEPEAAPTAGQTQFGGTPAEMTLPETGTAEGERITSALAETAARETPGGGLAAEALRRATGEYRSPLLRADQVRGYSFERAANPEDPVTRAIEDVAFGATEGVAPLRRAEQAALEGVGTAQPVLGRRPGIADVTTVGTGLGLANPASLAANFTGGVVRSAERVALELAGSTGNPLHAFTDLAAMGAELPRALAKLPGAIRAGPAAESRRLVGESVGAGLESRAIRGPTDIGGMAATAGTIGTRSNAATDALIRAVNEAGGAAVAARRGASEWEQLKAGQEAGAFATFTGSGTSPLADLLGQSRGWLSDPGASLPKRATGALAYSFAPYVRMPERLLMAALKTASDPVTQVGPFVRALRAGDTAALREARARMIVGASVDSALVAKYFDGGLTGDAPSDETERRAREAAGEQWNTIDVGGGVRVPLRYLGTVGQSAGLLASTLDRARAAEREGGDVGAILTEGFNGAAKWTLEESYLRDLARFGGDVLEGRASNQLERQAAGVVTRPLAAVAPLAATDPYQREAEGFLGQVQARVPFLREQLPARIDPTTGEPVQRVGTGFERALGAYGDRPSPVASEVARLEGAGSPVPVREFPREAKYAGMEQTPEARRLLQEEFGKITGQTVRGMMARADYQALADPQKAATLGTALRAAYELADLRVGDRVARDPQAKADLEWARTPQYEGVKGAPDEIALQNLQVREAKNLLAEYKQRYGVDQGELRLLREDRPAYLLADRAPLDRDVLALRRRRINERYGLPALEAERAPLPGVGNRPPPALLTPGAAFTAP